MIQNRFRIRLAKKRAERLRREKAGVSSFDGFNNPAPNPMLRMDTIDSIKSEASDDFYNGASTRSLLERDIVEEDLD